MRERDKDNADVDQEEDDEDDDNDEDKEDVNQEKVAGVCLRDGYRLAKEERQVAEPVHRELDRRSSPNGSKRALLVVDGDERRRFPLRFAVIVNRVWMGQDACSEDEDDAPARYSPAGHLRPRTPPHDEEQLTCSR